MSECDQKAIILPIFITGYENILLKRAFTSAIWSFFV